MNARFLNRPARTDNAATRPLDDAIAPSHAPAGLSDRACCCPARAMVQVVMPPAPARPRRIELLLCGHHYRVSRQALAAAGSTVRELPWIPDGTAAWIELGRDAAPAPIS
jgi:hypothetical protein